MSLLTPTPSFNRDIYYELHPRIDRSKKAVIIGVYGKSASGKGTFASLLANTLNGDGWRAQILSSDAYFKYPRAARNKMIESAWKNYGPSLEYDDVQREAFAIHSDLIKTDLKGLSQGYSIRRNSTYRRVTGEMNGSISLEFPMRGSNAIFLIDGMWLSGLRECFDVLVRLETAFEIRRHRYYERAAKMGYEAPPWMLENLDRVIEANIFKNWDLKDMVVRADEGFQLE
jgi:uridine kinase